MSRSPTDKYFKCERKKPWPSTEEGQRQAWAEARRLMAIDLAKGMVHRMTVYTCKYDPSHCHVGTRQSPFQVGYRGSLDAEGWAEELGITTEYRRKCSSNVHL